MSWESIIPTSVVRDLRVQLDSELPIRKVPTTCFFHFRRLRQIHRRVGQELTLRLVRGYVIIGLDYCNSLLAGLPLSSLEPVQRVQNAAVWLVFELNSREHITPSLLQLHWLPVRWRFQFQLYVIMHCVIVSFHYNGLTHMQLSVVTFAILWSIVKYYLKLNRRKPRALKIQQ